MNFEPQKFFIGLMDFFSILLPGALLTYLLKDEVGPVVLGDYKYLKLSGAEGVAVFLVTSYLFGHLIFLLGTWLDEFYDMDRRLTLNKQIKLLANRGKLLPWLSRMAIWLVFKRESDLAVNRAGKIKKEMLKGLQAKDDINILQAKDGINNFQWCKALLAKEHPASLATVQRFEADSKFFRCFVIVLLVLVVLWGWQDKLQLVGIGSALMPLAMWRYMEQRFKSTNQAYWSVITLMAKEGKISLEDKPATTVNSATHAGGVIFRKRWWGRVEYLLVEAKDDPAQWVLPKGHIEADENRRETAVREVHEETGVWAKIIADLGPVTFTVNGEAITTQFFLMKYAGRGLRQEASREHKWFRYDEAITKANHLETRDLLKLVEPHKIPEMLKSEKQIKAAQELLESAEMRRARL